MPNANETIRELAEENQLRKILLLIEKLEKEDKTLKELKELIESQLEK